MQRDLKNVSRKLFVTIAGLSITLHLFLRFFYPQISHQYFNLFVIFNGYIINTIFCLILVGILALVRKSNRLYMQVFLVLIFADSIYIYTQNINFLMHVLLIVILSRLYLIAIKQQIPIKPSVQEHLVSDE